MWVVIDNNIFYLLLSQEDLYRSSYSTESQLKANTPTNEDFCAYTYVRYGDTDLQVHTQADMYILRSESRTYVVRIVSMIHSAAIARFIKPDALFLATSAPSPRMCMCQEGYL